MIRCTGQQEKQDVKLIKGVALCFYKVKCFAYLNFKLIVFVF